MKKTNKTLAMILAALMVLTAPMTAFAAVYDNVTSAETITDAVENDSDSSVIFNLDSDIALEDAELNTGSGQTYVFNSSSKDKNTISNVNIGGSGTVVINANVKGTTGDALTTGDSASVTVNGDVESDAEDGVEADDNSKVTVNGDITAEDDGVEANDNAKVIVNGDITSLDDDGVDANDNAKVSVKGNITAEDNGIDATGNSTVNVIGDVLGDANDGGSGNGISVITEGDESVSVSVSGNVSSLGDDGIYVDTYDNSSASVSVSGSVSSEYDDGIEIYSSEASNSTIIVEGDISGDCCAIYGETYDSATATVYHAGKIDGDVNTYGVNAVDVSEDVSEVEEYFFSFMSTDLLGNEYTDTVIEEYDATLLVYFDPADEASVATLYKAQELYSLYGDDGLSVLGVCASDAEGSLDGITFPVLKSSESLTGAYKDAQLTGSTGGILVNSDKKVACASSVADHWISAINRLFK